MSKVPFFADPAHAVVEPIEVINRL